MKLTHLLTLTLMALAPARAAETHLWLLDQTNVPGIEITYTQTTLYGVLVLMDSDSPECVAFDIRLTVETSDGRTLVFTGRATRQPKSPNVTFSTAWSVYFDTAMAFKVKQLTITEVRQ
jgi:hypothetical protein